MQTGREPRQGPALVAARTPAAGPTRPGRPILSLKGKAPAPPQLSPPELPAAAEEGTEAKNAPAPKSVSVAPAAKKDTPAKSARPSRDWTKNRGPITAGPAFLLRAQTLNELLVAPIGVLPSAENDPVRPFRIGLGAEILARCKPEVTAYTCKRAVRDYVRSYSYRLASAQPGSMRHDLDGNPVEPVSETDRRHAQRSYEVDQERARQRKIAAALAAAAASAETGGSAEAAASSGSQDG